MAGLSGRSHRTQRLFNNLLRNQLERIVHSSGVRFCNQHRNLSCSVDFSRIVFIVKAFVTKEKRILLIQLTHIADNWLKFKQLLCLRCSLHLQQIVRFLDIRFKISRMLLLYSGLTPRSLRGKQLIFSTLQKLNGLLYFR